MHKGTASERAALLANAARAHDTTMHKRRRVAPQPAALRAASFRPGIQNLPHIFFNFQFQWCFKSLYFILYSVVVLRTVRAYRNHCVEIHHNHFKSIQFRPIQCCFLTTLPAKKGGFRVFPERDFFFLSPFFFGAHFLFVSHHPHTLTMRSLVAVLLIAAAAAALRVPSQCAMPQQWGEF